MMSLLPVATTLLAMVLSIEPLRIGGLGKVMPDFALMAAYYWAIFRPDLLPSLALFVIGMLQDLLCGGVPGLTALLLLLCRATLSVWGYPFLARPFPFLWAGFALMTGAAMLFLWSMNCLLAGELLDLRSPSLCAVVTISLFPIAGFLLGKSRRALAGAV
jgi:rod shape-determining protein MreD